MISLSSSSTPSHEGTRNAPYRSSTMSHDVLGVGQVIDPVVCNRLHTKGSVVEEVI